MGHVFKELTIMIQKKNFKNASSIINQFRIKTIENFDVYLKFRNKEIHTKTLDDGYFKILHSA